MGDDGDDDIAMLSLRAHDRDSHAHQKPDPTTPLTAVGRIAEDTSQSRET
jgi:hypothetical protein